MYTIIAIIFFYIAPIVLTIKTASLFAFLLTIVIWVVNTIILYYFCNWWSQTGSTTPKLSYRAFIRLYNVMPEDFTLNKYDLDYKNMIADFKSFSDWWRYRKFYKNIKKYKVKQEQLQRQAALISELQRGLAQEQIKADNFIKEKLNEHAQILNTPKKGDSNGL